MPSKFRGNRQNNREGERILAVDIVGRNMAYDLRRYGGQKVPIVQLQNKISKGRGTRAF